MSNVLTIFILLIGTIFCFVSDVYSLALFVAVRILVPETTRFLNTSLSINTILIVFASLSCAFFSLKKKREHTFSDKKFFLFLLVFALYVLISLFISNHTDIEYQIKSYIQFILTEIVPGIICIIVIRQRRSLTLVLKTLLISTFLTCVYAIFTVVIKSNPYISIWGDGALSNNWNGVATSSTFYSTNAFGYFLILILPFTIYLYEKKEFNQKCLIVLIMLETISIFLSKKRTAYIVLFLCLLMWFLTLSNGRKKKILVRFVPVLVVMLVLIFTVPAFSNLSNFIKASTFFWDDKAVTGLKTGQLGSSWELRVRQVTYPFVEIRDNLLFGKGFGWTGMYLEKYDLHPKLFGFETMFSYVVCEFGIVGIFAFAVFFYGFWKKICLKHKFLSYESIFVLCYILDIIGTGFNYFFLFIVFGILIMKTHYVEVGKYENICYNSCLQYRGNITRYSFKCFESNVY